MAANPVNIQLEIPNWKIRVFTKLPMQPRTTNMYQKHGNQIPTPFSKSLNSNKACGILLGLLPTIVCGTTKLTKYIWIIISSCTCTLLELPEFD